MNSARPSAIQAPLEARLASRLAGALSVRTQALPHDVTERLRVAREQAVARARQLRLQAAPAPVVLANGGGAAVFGRSAPWWQRAASVLPLVVLISGLLMMERWAVQEQVQAAAEIDAQLLSDNLPPAAYSDPGFGEFLRTAPVP